MNIASRVINKIGALMRVGVNYCALSIGLKKFNAKKIELGSGPVTRDGWITVDMCSGADVFWDLRFPLPFKDDSFSFLYSSHVIEHFNYRQLDRLLREMNRVLAPGGTMSICVPDARLYIDNYIKKADPERLLEYAPAIISHQPMDVLNYIFYMDGQHKHMFDPASLIHHLKMRGFVDCRERDFDASIDMVERQPTSFYVECRKAQS